ncbi:hypothetical protein, partial [Enterobacter asburiae]
PPPPQFIHPHEGIRDFIQRLVGSEICIRDIRMPLRHEIHHLILAGFREHCIDMGYPPFQMRLESLDGRKKVITLRSAAGTRPAGCL